MHPCNTSTVTPTVYHRDRTDGYGGVLLAHKSAYNSHQLSLDSDCEIIACQIDLSDNPLIVLAAYRPEAISYIRSHNVSHKYL